MAFRAFSVHCTIGYVSHTHTHSHANHPYTQRSKCTYICRSVLHRMCDYCLEFNDLISFFSFCLKNERKKFKPSNQFKCLKQSVAIEIDVHIASLFSIRISHSIHIVNQINGSFVNCVNVSVRKRLKRIKQKKIHPCQSSTSITYRSMCILYIHVQRVNCILGAAVSTTRLLCNTHTNRLNYAKAILCNLLSATYHLKQ